MGSESTNSALLTGCFFVLFFFNHVASHLSIQSVLSCTVMKITKPKLEAQEYLHSRVVRSGYVVAQIGYVWYHKVFVIQTKVDGLTMICTAK